LTHSKRAGSQLGSGVFLCCTSFSFWFSSFPMSDVPDPVRVHVDTDAQTLTVEWADDHESVFPLSKLREACPCAECGGKAVDNIPPPGAASLDDEPDPRWPELAIASIEPAGSIGIRIEWDDGHNAGIFRWDRLRRLQPPEEA